MERQRRDTLSVPCRRRKMRRVSQIAGEGVTEGKWVVNAAKKDKTQVASSPRKSEYTVYRYEKKPACDKLPGRGISKYTTRKLGIQREVPRRFTRPAIPQ